MSALIKPFEHGVLGVLHGHWELELQTPLVIRAGSEDRAKSAFRQQDRNLKKGRGTNMALAWKNSKDKFEESGWSQVTDFNYHFFIGQTTQELAVDYSIPASSIRGSLRQWAIKSWIERNKRDLFSLPKKENMELTEIAKKIEDVKTELKNTNGEWYNILSLFGCAFDIDPNDVDHPLTWAGRMRLEVKLKSDTTPKKIEACGKPIEEKNDGPQNINRHINVRNPIDRVTMAARDKGLHYGLEMSEGEKFAVDFHILNPKPKDVELINLWAGDIGEGYLRFGGLTSQGRGRVEFTKESYDLFASRSSMLFDKINQFGKPTDKVDPFSHDLWNGATLKREELTKDKFELLEKKSGDCHVSLSQSV